MVPGGMIVDMIEYRAEIIIKRCEDRERSEYIAIFKINGKVLKILRNIDPREFCRRVSQILKTIQDNRLYHTLHIQVTKTKSHYSNNDRLDCLDEISSATNIVDGIPAPKTANIVVKVVIKVFLILV